jgi:hypothetical protein
MSNQDKPHAPAESRWNNRAENAADGLKLFLAWTVPIVTAVTVAVVGARSNKQLDKVAEARIQREVQEKMDAAASDPEQQRRFEMFGRLMREHSGQVTGDGRGP